MIFPGHRSRQYGQRIVFKIKRGRRLLRTGYIVFTAIIISGFLIFYLFFRSSSIDRKLPEEKISLPAIPEKENIQPLKEHKITIPQGKTIADLLSPFLSSQLISELLTASRPLYNLNRIMAGHNLILKLLENGDFHSLTYEIDKAEYLEIKKDNDGISASLQTLPLEKRICFLSGEIKGNLIEALNLLGEKDYLALSLAEIFAWEIDFYLDLRAGDTFALIFEKNYRENEFVSYGNILAAQIINQGKKYQAFRFISPETGRADYFDARGSSLRKEFLRSPIKYARITSRYSHRRLHPIQKIYRPHYGVDYAAPVGTPVQATADGLVTFAGWNGSSGRMIRLRHKNGYETLYLHLRNFASGIKAGARVKAGDIIGYVGSSGESTGPHLDYRITYHGRYINPLAWRFEPAEPLPAEYLETFKNEIKFYEFLLNHPLWFARLLPY
jgi:murein DD-endopeptidase MepM/ murein hydrolase activator NlpD